MLGIETALLLFLSAGPYSGPNFSFEFNLSLGDPVRILVIFCSKSLFSFSI